MDPPRYRTELLQVTHACRKDTDILPPFLIGLVFFGVGGLLYYRGSKPIVFDKRSGCYWNCRRAFNPRATAEYTQLSDIHALQLITEHVRGSKSSYRSYELNLVLDDGGRINVVDHGNRERLREDARVLSEFLGKPVWDAT